MKEKSTLKDVANNYLTHTANEKAITLIALVVTIVILLILAGVTITMTLGQNGLFTRAREGAAAYEESEVRDDLSMLITQYTWDKASEKTDKSLGDYLKENGATSVKANADGATARSLTIEDIESRMNSKGIAARNAYKSGTTQYGTTRKYTGSNAQYPAIYVQEKYSGVDVSDVTDGTQVITGSVDATAQSKMNPNGKSGSDNIYTTLPETSETTGPSKTNLTCTQTFWGVSQSSSYYDDANFYNMIFGTGANFWLASRYVGCNSNDSYAHFGLRYVTRSNLGGNDLFDSDGGSYFGSNCFAPVVSLGSGIQVKSGSGTTSDPYEIGK